MRRAVPMPLLAVLVTAVAFVTVGCGTQPPTSTAGTSSPTTPRMTVGSTIAGPSCLELGKAVEAVTTTDDLARADQAIDAITAYDPPQEVTDALDVLREAVDDTQVGEASDEARATLYAWVGAVCP